VEVDLDTMVEEYLRFRGLDRTTGLPPRTVLEELELAQLLG
jgi:aldehyde:ferredoxin oxidoreductase